MILSDSDDRRSAEGGMIASAFAHADQVAKRAGLVVDETYVGVPDVTVPAVYVGLEDGRLRFNLVSYDITARIHPDLFDGYVVGPDSGSVHRRIIQRRNEAPLTLTEAAIEAELADLHLAAWGRSFPVYHSEARAEAARWLAPLVERVLARLSREEALERQSSVELVDVLPVIHTITAGADR